MVDRKASLDALAVNSHKSVKETRSKLELAFARLRHGNPKAVAKGTPITPTSVAEEAGVRRETLYRFHEPVLTQIRKYNDQEPNDKLRKTRTDLIKEQATAKELRQLAEAAQEAEKALARINHRLAARIAELEQQLSLREQTIGHLRASRSTGLRVLSMDPKKT